MADKKSGSGPLVRTGADRLEEAASTELAGARIGLVTCPTGVNARFEPTIYRCAALRDARLTALFACEHGIRGERQAGVLFGDEIDPRTGVPVFSLYGETRKPTEAMLAHVDAVLFDIQDIGVRFFTYLTTLVYVMEACAQAGKTMVVLDRPNPFGGFGVEGGKLVPGYESMVGVAAIPFRTGMTIGEFARYMNDRIGKPCDLKVVELQGWRRAMEFADTGLPWIPTSPNTPTLDTCRVYPGTCMFEGTNVSEGRGTTRPFETVGAPWLDGERLAREMNGLGLPGVHFMPAYFTPTFSKHQGELCSGVQLYVTDKRSFRSVETGLKLLHRVIDLSGDRFEWLPPFKEGRKPFIDYLTGSDRVRLMAGDADGVERLLADWERDVESWSREREAYLLYD